MKSVVKKSVGFDFRSTLLVIVKEVRGGTTGSDGLPAAEILGGRFAAAGKPPLPVARYSAPRRKRAIIW